MAEYLDVDPRTLHLPPSRWAGADPAKFSRQLSRHGRSTAGMPPPWVHRDAAGRLKIIDGVTRATRVARLLPGTLIGVVVTADRPSEDYSTHPTVGDRLP